jgi:signal transduction histidine kinase
VLAVAFDPSYGGGKRILAAEVSLKRLANYVASLSTADIDVKLLDGRGRLFAAGSIPRVDKLEPQRVPGAREGELPAGEIVAEYFNGNRHLIGAYAPVAPFGLGAVVDKTEGDALRPVARIRWATLFWMLVSIIVGSLAAWLFARRLSERLGALAAGSKQIATGNLDTRIAEDGGDELANLATSFNQMATSLDAARKKITQQTNEIMAWNQTLEKRVEEKTNELRAAQDLLLRSRSLSALGELGAGVAHEINNPLTGALGIVQLLLADLPAGHPAVPLLQDLEREALRIRKIVQNMLRLAQRQSGTDTTLVELPRVLDDAIELCGPSELSGAGIEVVRKYEPAPPIRANATQLEEAFIQLIQNARAAMVGQRAGKLTLEIKAIENKLVRVAIADTGAGITAENLPRIFDPFFTTRSTERSGSGLGLSFVHRIVEDNGGTTQVESTPGAGTKFTLTFPADVGRAHRT